MSPRLLFTALLPLIAVIPVSPAPQPFCEVVAGTITARVGRIHPALTGLRMKGRGASDGDLPGVVQVEALKRFDGGLEVGFRITGDRGTLAVHGRATAPNHPVLPDMKMLSSELVVEGGSGGYTGRTGQLTVSGSVDMKARAIQVNYRGTVCSVEPTSL